MEMKPAVLQSELYPSTELGPFPNYGRLIPSTCNMTFLVQSGKNEPICVANQTWLVKRNLVASKIAQRVEALAAQVSAPTSPGLKGTL